MAKKNKTNAAPPPVQMMGDGPAPAMAMTHGAMPPPAKGKKAKAAKNAPAPMLTQEQMMSMSPEQLSQMQLEEAIKESQNPSMRLRKLRNPLSVRGCLLNLLFLIILTLVAVFAVIGIFYVDKFNIGVIFNSMMREFRIYDFFNMIGNWFSNLFSGGCGS